jgi:16S rRNA (guanine1207-N2)-methyltransferase
MRTVPISSGLPPEDYTTLRRLEVRLGDQIIPVITKPGLADWRQVTPAAALLAEHAALPAGARALLLGCGHGATAVFLARRLQSGELWIMDNSAIALAMTAATLQANQASNAHMQWEIDLPVEQNGAFDAAAIELPKGRKLAQRWLALAWTALRPGGSLYLAGPNELGIQSALQDATGLFGPGSILGYKKGNRIARFTRPAEAPAVPLWLTEPGIATGSWYEFDLQTPEGPLHLYSLPGIFSYDRLDQATRLLLEQMRVSASDRILDLGCGYGVLGLVAAKMGALHVDLVDSNLLAVAATRRNIRQLGLPNARALPGDVLSPVAGNTYTRIFTNPPFHSGKGVDYQIAAAFIRQSWAALEPGGELLLVANRFIRYEKIMEALFCQVNVSAQDNRYRILAATK